MIEGSFDWLTDWLEKDSLIEWMTDDGLSEMENKRMIELMNEWRINWVCSRSELADFNSWRWRLRLEISYSDWKGFWRHEAYDWWSDERMNGKMDGSICG